MATFTNVATLTYGENTTTSNTVVGEILEVLTVNKTAVEETYTVNDDITYVINLINSGNAGLNGLTVTDNLGSFDFEGQTLTPLTYKENSIRYFVNGVLQATPTVTATSPLTVTGINVPANSNAAIVYEAVPNQFASPEQDAAITNEVVVSGGGITPATAEATVTARNGANLSIIKALSPTVVTENGEITYTFTIQNFGNEDVAATDTVLSDTFNPILDITAVTFNGTAWEETVNYTYDETTGQFTTVAGNITVPAATVVQNEDGSFTVIPSISTLTVVGTV